MLLNNQQITLEIEKEVKICIRTNDNENMKTQTLQDSVKAGFRGKSIAIQACLKKQEKRQINNLMLHLKQLKNEKIPKLVEEIIKEIIKNREEINEKRNEEDYLKHQQN